MPFDSNGNKFNEDAGSTTPTEGKCNWPLTNWRERYDEKRYCQRWPLKDANCCKKHHGLAKGQPKGPHVRAQELFQHGLFTKTVDHLYARLDPWQQICAWGLFEYLLDESTKEYAAEFNERTFDFSETDPPAIPETAYDDVVIEEDDEGDPAVIALDVPYPTDHGDRAVALWLAATDSVKMINVQAKIAADEMEVETTEYAEFDTATIPTEGGGETKSWQTLEEVKEHHLNLPYSRLVRDRKELLKYGGIPIDGETNDSMEGIVLTDFSTGVDADPEVDSVGEDIVAETNTSLEELDEQVEQ